MTTKKNVLITGAGGNLGNATVERFIEEGYKIIAVDVPGKDSGLQDNDRIDIVKADLTSESEVEKTMASIWKKYETIHAALFIAGGYHYGGLKDTDGATIDKMINLNFKTGFFIAKNIFLKMLDQSSGGRLVFVGAKPALVPSAGKDALAYALSKSLVFQFADLLNAEGASKGVTASVIVPSIIDTPPNRKAMPNANFDHWVKPEEIADALAYLCSDNSSALRGTVLKIYGKS